VLGIEVRRVRRERRAGRVLDALIDGQDRHISGAGEAAVIDERLQARQDARGTVGARIDTLDVVGTRRVQQLFRDRLALVLEEVRRVSAENLLDFRRGINRSDSGHVLYLMKERGLILAPASDSGNLPPPSPHTPTTPSRRSAATARPARLETGARASPGGAV